MRRSILLCVALCLSASSLQAQEQFLGKSANEWVTQLKNNQEWKQRRNAAFALGKLGKHATLVVEDMKIAYRNEAEVKVREATVYALGEIGHKNALVKKDGDLEKLLLDAIASDYAPLRRSAAFALGCLATRSRLTRQALDTAIGDQEPMVRQNAAWALVQFSKSDKSQGKEDAVPSLKKLLGDKDSLVKREAATALGQMEDGDKVYELVDDLLPLCQDADSETRRTALGVLVQIVDAKNERAIPFLASAMEKPDLENRGNAAIAISKIGGPKSVVALPGLIEAAKAGDVEMRRQAVLAFRNLNVLAAPAVPDLIVFLRDDPDTMVKKHAALSLAGIGEASVRGAGFGPKNPRQQRRSGGPHRMCDGPGQSRQGSRHPRRCPGHAPVPW